MAIARDAFYSMLGIAMRARALTLGTDAVLGAIASGQAALVLVDAGASENTRKRFRDACAYRGAPLFETAPDRLGASVGKPGRMCAAVSKGPLGEKLMQLAREG